MLESDSNQSPTLVSAKDLSEEALRGVIESFILREGTDYGVYEVNFAQKFSQVLKKIEREEYVITFDPGSETVTLLTRQQWADFQKGKQNEL